jgi:D-alanyl-D-alanine carboxypeptidase
MKDFRHDHVNISLVYVLGALSILALINIHFLILPTKSKVKSPHFPIITRGITFSKEPFLHLPIVGRAYVVYDVKSNTLIAENNATTTLPLASLTKVMTTITALTHNNTITPITVEKKYADRSLDLGLKEKEEWELGELLKYTLVFSSNDGALIIASSLGGTSDFVRQMSNDSMLFGFPMLFTNPAGLDEGTSIGGLGTALNTAKMLAYAELTYPEIFDATIHKRYNALSESGVISGIPNTNQEIESISGALASKTGYTDSAGGNLAVMLDISVGHPVVIVVLGSTREARFKDVKTLYNALKKSITTPDSPEVNH